MNKEQFFNIGFCREEDQIPMDKILVPEQLMELLRSNVDLSDYSSEIKSILFGAFINLGNQHYEPIYLRAAQQLDLVIPVPLSEVLQRSNQAYFEFLKIELLNQLKLGIAMYHLSFNTSGFEEKVRSIQYSPSIDH